MRTRKEAASKESDSLLRTETIQEQKLSSYHEEIDSLQKKGFTRRHLGRITTLLAGGAALPFYNEFAMAQDAQQRMRGARRAMDPDAVRISSNENPLGPCKEGLEAIAKVAPYGGRYSPFNEQGEFVTAVAEMEGVKESYVAPFAGSSDPLHRSSCAFTSPTRSWTMANPGYGGGAPEFIGSKVVRIPLRADFSHDVQKIENRWKICPGCGRRRPVHLHPPPNYKGC